MQVSTISLRALRYALKPTPSSGSSKTKASRLLAATSTAFAEGR
jgi:hypothetical protein